ncbi:MAG: hypothetical protein N3B21_07990 [Clostridia bacterium]|nr:hypothetical protein [Clostridia bacterium]
MTAQIIIPLVALAAFVVLGFMMSKSIKTHETQKSMGKKKKVRAKSNMPEVKNFSK